RLETLPPSSLGAEGIVAARLLEKAPYWDQYETILLFLSTPLEIDTAPLLALALIGDKKVFAPRTEGKRIRFYRVLNAAGPWKEGPFDIREPEAGAVPLKAGDFPVLVMVPGLAFDRFGNRLGHGRAYYDRFFAEKSGPCLKIGLCADIQILPSVPADPWDVPMDAICTGSRLIPIAQEPSE
ncbi:MAG: 5-formyltetrahydrofolate cyclo-ligase, partial [Treponema sp.]|nr:5-formyltetrahydrofolate cyclo-ligase [Treponema sp.]